MEIPAHSDHILVGVSDLQFTPLRPLQDAVQVMVSLGESEQLVTDFQDEVDRRFVWSMPNNPSQLKLISGVYNVELIIRFRRNAALGISKNRTSQKIQARLKDALLYLTAYTIKLEDGTIMGTLDIKLNMRQLPQIPLDLIDAHRQTRIPILNHIRHTMVALPLLECLIDPQYHHFWQITTVIHTSLWVQWRIELPELIHRHSAKSADRDDAIVASVLVARNNALEDTILQVQRQLRLAVLCFVDRSKSHAFSTRHARLIQRLFETAAECAIVVYQWADTHPDATWDAFDDLAYGTGSGIRRERFVDGAEDLERLHHDLLVISHEMNQVYRDDTRKALSESREHFLRALYTNALEETRQGESQGLYTSTFEGILGPATQKVFGWIEQDFKEASNTSLDRDVLRRLMTHLAQHSNRLPRSMMLGNIEYFKTDRELPRPVAGGSFADVYIGVKDSHSLVAIKQLRVFIGTEAMETRIKQVYLEILTCHTMNHPNVLAVMGISTDINAFSIITPWLANGTVYNYLEMISSKYLTTPSWLLNRWINHISKGLAYLHTEGLVHGDLRGVNVLIDDDEVALIADFGLAVYSNGHSANYASLRTGNPQWLAPELLRPQENGTVRPSMATDVYSLSHVCIELYTSGPPYPDLANPDGGYAFGRFINDILAAESPKRPSRPKQMTNMLWDLLQTYWSPEPTARPSAHQVAIDVLSLDQQGPARAL